VEPIPPASASATLTAAASGWTAQDRANHLRHELNAARGLWCVQPQSRLPSSAGAERQSVANPQAARARARPLCRHVNNQSRCSLGSAFERCSHLAFAEEEQLAITVGGGCRRLPILSNAMENVALIGIHWKDEFIGLMPWEGSIDWEVDTWGRWLVRGSNASYDAEVLASCAVRSVKAPSTESHIAMQKLRIVMLRVWHGLVKD
jgi:hypothetical protein